MAINTYPAVASPVKSVQRGSAAGAGTVTITAVDTNKSFVNIYGTTSSGTVSASFGLSTTNSDAVAIMPIPFTTNDNARWSGSGNSLGITFGNYNNVTNNSGTARQLGASGSSSHTVNAGSTNLVAAVIQGYLSNSTSLVVSGACRWEVVEYN